MSPPTELFISTSGSVGIMPKDWEPTAKLELDRRQRTSLSGYRQEKDDEVIKIYQSSFLLRVGPDMGMGTVFQSDVWLDDRRKPIVWDMKCRIGIGT